MTPSEVAEKHTILRSVVGGIIAVIKETPVDLDALVARFGRGGWSFENRRLARQAFGELRVSRKVVQWAKFDRNNLPRLIELLSELEALNEPSH